MRFFKPSSSREAAQQFAYDAMEAKDQESAARLCREALAIYPDCVDALSLLAEINCRTVREYIAAMRRAVEAGRRDLGDRCFKRLRGRFWLALETRPYMRAMACLADSLRQCVEPECIDEAIGIYERMLELNPNDNQGVRDPLAGCYLQRNRYDDAANLLRRYEKDWMAVACWSRVLLAWATSDEQLAAELLEKAREQNPFVELYLTGRKRRPRTRPDFYSPGEDSEAVLCADLLSAAWTSHPKARKWLKERCAAS